MIRSTISKLSRPALQLTTKRCRVRSLMPWRMSSLFRPPRWFFEEPEDEFFMRPFTEMRNWIPMDLKETKKDYIVCAEVPGLKKEDIKISLKDNVLSISGEVKREQEDKDETFHRIERSYGAFARSIQLPKDVDTKNIDASYNNGILEIKLPKLEKEEEKEVQTIEIK